MKTYNFDAHPRIQACMRRLMTFGTLDEGNTRLLLDELESIFTQFEHLRNCESLCECGAFT